ncbi:MAG TPA: hypothetical protein VM733_12590 [Thermoanaerobaculia bacterium]|nr:hypothetical protein [Thermoanaerobaculia bacterium]
MFKYGCCLAVFLAVTASVYANPDFSQDAWYYDEEGNVIGWFSVPCTGGPSFGGDWYGDIYEVINGEACTDPPVNLPTCSQQGLYTLSDCGNYWCYSGDFLTIFEIDLIPNCHGVCAGGEGPGAVGGLWCSTCYQGTGSCPAKLHSRPKRKARPTLRAALDAKMAEILAPLRPRG